MTLEKGWGKSTTGGQEDVIQNKNNIQIHHSGPDCGAELVCENVAWLLLICWVLWVMSLASGTMCGSCRSGWRTGSWHPAAQRKLWSRSDKQHSFYRSTRRLRQMPRLFAICALSSTQHRSGISKCSAFFSCRHDVLLTFDPHLFVSVDCESVDIVHPSDWIWRASVGRFHLNC